MTGTLIACDLDDVLSKTNEVVADWFNKNYGTPETQMTVNDFYYYFYWKNPYWGTPAITNARVKEMYDTDAIEQTLPVEGALESLQALKAKGYRFIVITARFKTHQEATERWVAKYFPDIFEQIVCTGHFEGLRKLKSGEAINAKVSKQDVCEALGAKLLIDDSIENALTCVTNETYPVTTLVFGEGEWNRRICLPNEHRDDMTFSVRASKEGGTGFLDADAQETQRQIDVLVSQGAPLYRVKDWNAVVEWLAVNNI